MSARPDDGPARDTSNGRVVEVVNFLASHPTDSFTLSQIAAQLRLSQGSAHRVLTALTAAGYLSRHPKHKTYSLGLALVMIGQAAMEKHHGIAAARRAMARLTDDLNVQCTASAVISGEMLILAREGVPQTPESLSRVGERRPFIPPYGLVQVAWAGDAEIHAFLARFPDDLVEAKALLRGAIGLVRQRGYAMATNGSGQRALRQALLKNADAVRDADFWQDVHSACAALTGPEIQLDDAAEAGPEGICYISAPIFATDGSVALALTLGGLPTTLGAVEIEQYAARLCAVTAMVTSETHGRAPA